MSAEPYIGQIELFAGAYAPRDWLLCDGQVLKVREHPELYAVIGSRFGGDGKTSFALPDLRGRTPIHRGAAAGGTERGIGTMGGAAAVSLTDAQVPAHIHRAAAWPTVSSSAVLDPTDAVWGRSTAQFFTNSHTTVKMRNDALAPSGDGVPHNNMQPFLSLTFIIAARGIFPTR